jgi:hypothetical protein
MSGLKKTQATAIVKTERVRPTTMAKMTAAMATIEERSQPTNGIMFKMLMTGAKRR